MISALDISASGLVAQRMRLNAVAGNLANMSSPRNERGELEPYRPRFVQFETDPNLRAPSGAMGVRVASVETEEVEPIYRHQPGHPLAIKEGRWKDHVAYPNINMTSEFVDALEASRAYEANIGVMEITKAMDAQSLRILV